MPGGAGGRGGRARHIAPIIMRAAMSPAEPMPSSRRLREADALAQAVGGRRGRAARMPPDRFLRRLERAAQGFLRHDSSCFVRGRDRR